MGFKGKRAAVFVVGLLALVSACKEPDRNTLPVYGKSVFDVVKTIQSGDYELFSTYLREDSEVARQYSTRAEFDRLVAHFKSFEERAQGGWDMIRVQPLDEVGEWEVAKKTDTESSMRRPEIRVYDIVVYKATDEKTGEKIGTQKIARVRIHGYYYDSWIKYSNSINWHNTTYFGSSWKLNQINLD